LGLKSTFSTPQGGGNLFQRPNTGFSTGQSTTGFGGAGNSFGQGGLSTTPFAPGQKSGSFGQRSPLMGAGGLTMGGFGAGGIGTHVKFAPTAVTDKNITTGHSQV
jgi:hypothetical protein